MPDPSPQPRAGGVLLAVAMVAGAVGGLALGQPTLGLFGGLAIGGLLCLAVWAADRRRR